MASRFLKPCLELKACAQATLWIALLLAMAVDDETFHIEIVEFFGVVQRFGSQRVTAKAFRERRISIDGLSNIRVLQVDTSRG